MFFLLLLRKQNVAHFFFISLTQNFVFCLQITIARHCNFLQIVSAVTIRQWLLISASCLCITHSLIFSPTKQPYSKVGNSRMYQYGNAAFISNFHQKLKYRKWRYQFRVANEFLTNICVNISSKKIICLFFR